MEEREREFKILIFSLSGDLYATDICDVERILDYSLEAKMPESPEFIEGVINHQDEVLPIINLSKKFKLESEGEGIKDKIIVVKKDNKKYGVVVDGVHEVKNISMSFYEKYPKVLSTTMAQNYVEGLIKLNNKIITLLNLGQILTGEEEENIFD